MFYYYLRLAFLSIKRNPILSTLMISAIGLGIGASMTMISVQYAMGSNPIPHKSEQLFYVQLDSWDPNEPYDEPNEPPDQLTWLDATALLKNDNAFRHNASSKLAMVMQPDGQDVTPFMASGRGNLADFFPMFDTPFQFGSGWDKTADDNLEMVTVLSKATNEKLFGGQNSVGNYIRIGDNNYKVVGVLDDWNPTPKFYDVTNGAFNETEEFYIPFNLIASLELPRAGNTSCWKPSGGEGFQAFLQSECIWLQYWVELPTEADKQAYMDFLNNYTDQQKALGRFPRPSNNRLSNVMELMESKQVVQDDIQVLVGLSLMFLLVCLLNTIGLLLAKFLGKASEIGLRRAVGASKATLFVQHLVEAGLIGVAGGILGLALAYLGHYGIGLLFSEDISRLLRIDLSMVFFAIGLAIISSLLAGLYPTWRACNIAPALQLKTQ